MKLKKIILALSLLNSIYCIDKIHINNEQEFKLNSIDPYTMEVTITINEVDLEQVVFENVIYTDISISGSYPSSIIGSPNLPMLNKLIEIPRGANPRIEIIKDNIKEYKGTEYNINSLVSPSQPSISKSQTNRNFVINNAIYTTNTFYKNELITIIEKGFLRETKIANIMIFFRKYNN